MDSRRRTTRWLATLAGLIALAASACSTGQLVETNGSVSGPAVPQAAVCGHVKKGPAEPPAGAVRVDPAVPGDLINKVANSPAGTTFWLAPGTHKLGNGPYDQVSPQDGDTFIGAPGAVLDGQRVNQYAFVGYARNVTIAHLTVRGFVAPQDQGVVNHDSGDGWRIEHNTVTENGGAGLMAGSHQVVRGNCLKDNGQYGMNAYKAGKLTDLVVVGNEIVGNNTDDWESKVDGCGCTGGVKFWAVDKADIRGNWVHDNRGTGLWADTNNNDFLIEKNVIEDNDGPAIFYEISYNAIIRDNIIERNNLVQGREFADRGDSFPSASIYLSEAGGEPRIKARTGKIDIYRNTLSDNWSGITLWENADRFCNSPSNTSGGCTMLVPDQQRCAPPKIADEPLYSDCRWRTQNVDIHDNRFSLNPSKVDCNSLCARMAVLSNYGTYPEWSPYQGHTVQQAITFDQHNTWRHNYYVGPWTFMAQDTATVVDSSQWRAGPYNQDAGSTFVGSTG